MEQTSADFNLNELGRVESGFACLGQSGPGGATETLAASARTPLMDTQHPPYGSGAGCLHPTGKL